MLEIMILKYEKYYNKADALWKANSRSQKIMLYIVTGIAMSLMMPTASL